MLKDLVAQNRSYRRFDESAAVDLAFLRELVDLARQTASGANKQPLKYVLSADSARNTLIFKHLAWAGYLSDWPGPGEGERPAAYIVILGDKEIAKSFGCDQGIAAQTILLGAVEKGLGGCMLGAIDRDGLRESLQIPEQYDILLVLALGKPAEKVIMEPVGSEGDIKYWRDPPGVHHVPKRILDEIILA